MLDSIFAGPYILFVLACPVGMGLMMLFMGKGMMGGKSRNENAPGTHGEQPLETLKAEQARLAEKISALEQRAASHPDERTGAAVEEPERTPA